jgi:hypothetical protein
MPSALDRLSTRPSLHAYRLVALVALLGANVSACVTDSSGDGAQPSDPSAVAAASSDGEKPVTEADDTGNEAGESAETAATSPAAVPPGERLELGPVENEDLKHEIYEAMEKRLAHGDATSNGAEAATEIGDYDAFKFTIVKLTRGKDDVSGDPTTPPDGMDVEVTGWLRRTLADNGSGAEKSECVSFDAQIAMHHEGEAGWAIAKDQDVAFGRQDQEDCY